MIFVFSRLVENSSSINSFCLQRSQDHGTVDVVVVVLLLLLGGTTLVFDFFQDTEIFME